MRGIGMEIYFNKRKKVLVNKNEIIANCNLENNDVYIATILKNLEHYGFTLSVQLIDELRKVNPNYMVKWYKDLEEVIKNEVGVRENQEPMYKNFPQEVMELSEIELYINAIIHYATFGEVYPESEKEERIPLNINKDKLTILELGTEEDFYSIFKNLLESKTSLSATDMKYIDWAIENIEFKNIVPETITIKEILVSLSKFLLKHNKIEEFELLKPLYKNATDVLRFAVKLSDGDVSLSTKPYFKSFSVRERKLILSLLDQCKNIEEDMYRYKEYWKRLGEKIYPFKYQQYENSVKGFEFIRSSKKMTSFKGKVEKAFKDSNLKELLRLLSSRPGEFARSLDRVLRTFNTEEESKQTIEAFESVAKDIPTTLLLQVKKHFEKRTKTNDFRLFFPKGSVSKSYNIEYNLQSIEKEVCLEVASICTNTLINIYGQKESLGNVYLDINLFDYITPMSQRNASKTLRTVARGSRIKIGDNSNILRAFIYWKNPTKEKANCYSECVDIDLSIATYTEDFRYHSSLGYFQSQNKYTKELYTFSGDIRNAPNGAAEYIDLNVKNLMKEDIRYVVVSVNSFSNHEFKNLPECFAGVMEREDMQTGEVFEPSTITNKIDLSNGSVASVPMIIDLKTREIIWADMSLRVEHDNLNNVLSTKNSLTYIIKSLIDVEKTNLYELFLLHSIARGTAIVNNIEDADTVFTVDTYEYPYEEILSKLQEERSNLESSLRLKHVKDIDIQEIEELKSINKKIEEVKYKNIVNITAYDMDIIVSQFI